MIGLRILLVAIYLIVSNSCFLAQELFEKETLILDSLDQLLLNDNTSDSVKVSIYLQKAEIFYYKNSEATMELCVKAKSISDSINYLAGKANSYAWIGLLKNNEGSHIEAIEILDQALDFYTALHQKDGMANALNSLGSSYTKIGDVSKALESFFLALDIETETKNKRGISFCLNNIGYLYNQQNDTENALVFYEKALKIQEELNLLHNLSISLTNIGKIYLGRKEFEKALNCYRKSLKIKEKLKNIRGIGILLGNIGLVYKRQGKYVKAHTYYNNALKIQDSIKDKVGVMKSRYYLGDLFFEWGDKGESTDNLLKSLKLAQELGYPKELQEISLLLSEVYDERGEKLKALKMYKLAMRMKDSLINETNLKSTIQQKINYDYEKKKVLIRAENEKEIALGKIEEKKQKELTILFSLILGFVTLFLIFIYRKLKLTKKQKKIIEFQKKELSFTHAKLAEASQEISDSIDYAELIQQAVLPSIKIEDLTKESFIYFNPKEKVSGDFYWIEQREEYHGYAVADCTGHGIPGAFISMIGTILLNEIYNSKKIYLPHEILDELSRLVRLTLTNKEGYTMKDGMDISFAVLDSKTKMLYFSGANNPIWIASKNPNKRINKTEDIPLSEKEGKYLYEIKGDKQPVGDYGDNVKPFSLNSAHLEEGDVFYLFSDGYVDQFGGERNKKFKAKPFRELLLTSFDEKMDDQLAILNEHFQSWKGDFEQIDDVTIMGIRV